MQLGNEARIRKEVREAALRLASPNLPPEVVERVALACVELEAGHGQLQTNINQQFEKLLTELGELLSPKNEATP